jgi:anti-anti-sigma factor
MQDEKIKLEIKEIVEMDNARLINFSGDLDSTNVEAILVQITDLINRGIVHLVADFTHLRYVNSTGLGILLHISKTAKAKGGQFRLAHINDNVYEIIEIIGATSLLDIYEDVEDAIKALN